MMKGIVSALGLLFAVPLNAQPAAPAAAAQLDAAAEARLSAKAEEAIAVLSGERAAAEVFSPAFLAQVSAAQLEQVTQQLTASYGPLIGVERVTPAGPYSAEIALRFERAIGHGTLAISPEAPHLVTGLMLQRFEAIDDSVGKVRSELEALPGEVNAWFGPLDGATPVLSLNADQPLALGSTFKLYVLAALARSIADGEHRWDEVVPLAARSYPSGVMQNWPQGAPVTLHTLATLMLQVSDNTATDQLIAILGRDQVEAELRRTNADASRSLPFLTTHEMFTIKADPQLRARYAAAGEAERRRMLQSLPAENTPLIQVSSAFAGNPLEIDRIEWFASPSSLSRLLAELTQPQFAEARKLLTANRNMTEEVAAEWQFAGYKGGSEPGVLNLTWLLQDKAGRWHMLTTGWNNPDAPVDTTTLDALAKRLLALHPQ